MTESTQVPASLTCSRDLAALPACEAEPTTTIAADLEVCAAEDRVWDLNWRATGVVQAAEAIPDRINEREAMHILKAVLAKLHPDAEDFSQYLDEAIAGLDVAVARLGIAEAEESYGLLVHPNLVP